MRKTLLLISAAVFGLGGCDLFGNDGKLNLKIADAPYTDVRNVTVTVRKIRLEKQDGGHESFTLDTPVAVDLRQLTGGASQVLLSEEALPSGEYQSIRLMLSDNADDHYVIRSDGNRYRLDISGDELGIDADFSIDNHGTTDLTLDVDLRSSLREPDVHNDDYRLEPVMRLVEDKDSGTVSGTIPASKIDGDGSDCAVYAYKGEVTPDDIGGSGSEPYTSTVVSLGSDGLYRYKVAFLPEGSYTLGLSCNVDEDDPEANDDLDFRTEHVKVDAGDDETQNF
jgi:hypothetical protein